MSQKRYIYIQRDECTPKQPTKEPNILSRRECRIPLRRRSLLEGSFDIYTSVWGYIYLFWNMFRNTVFALEMCAVLWGTKRVSKEVYVWHTHFHSSSYRIQQQQKESFSFGKKQTKTDVSTRVDARDCVHSCDVEQMRKTDEDRRINTCCPHLLYNTTMHAIAANALSLVVMVAVCSGEKRRIQTRT